jgi:predicted DNA-binding transcriptional regulator AlpA
MLNNQTTTDTLDSKRFGFSLLRPKEAADALGCSIATLYRWAENDPNFPQKFKINGIVGWRKDSIIAYQDSNAVPV